MSFPVQLQPAQLWGQSWQDVPPAQNTEGNEVSLASFARELSAGPLAPRLLPHLAVPFRPTAASQPPAKSSKPYRLPAPGRNCGPGSLREWWQPREMEGRGEKLLCQCETLGTPLQGVRQQSRLQSSLNPPQQGGEHQRES